MALNIAGSQRELGVQMKSELHATFSHLRQGHGSIHIRTFTSTSSDISLFFLLE